METMAVHALGRRKGERKGSVRQNTRSFVGTFYTENDLEAPFRVLDIDDPTGDGAVI
jgi:hypothetical protein